MNGEGFTGMNLNDGGILHVLQILAVDNADIDAKEEASSNGRR